MAKKKTKSSSTVNVDAIKRSASKIRKEVDSQSSKPAFSKAGFGEAAPGTIQRQSPLEQEMGTGKYREMIHDHNDKNKHILDRLPFTFPKKKKIRSSRTVGLECPNCSALIVGSEFTIGAVCGGCRKYVSLSNAEAIRMGHNPDLKVGIDGTAEDLIGKRKALKKK